MSCYKLIMKNCQQNWQNIFDPKIPQFLKVEVSYFFFKNNNGFWAVGTLEDMPSFLRCLVDRKVRSEPIFITSNSAAYPYEIWSKIAPILKFEVRFFSDQKCYSFLG